MANDGIPQGSGDLYALFKTTRGTLTVKLFEKDAPKTVANFVGLATGAKEWTDPRSGAKSHAKLYDGTQFHRVIPQFMIQGGDPLGQGVGGPGYKFADEFGSGKSFDKPGLLAMANAGPNTNGSQFFITEVPTPHLNNKHTIFGEVVKGFELVPQIARAGNAQTQLTHVEIVRSASVPQ
jgi:peptidyl-prolyl cis-trans isomerase A (cyclophilin A)